MEQLEEKVLFKNTTKLEKEDYKEISYFFTIKYNIITYCMKVFCFTVLFLLIEVCMPVIDWKTEGKIDFSMIVTEGIIFGVIFLIFLKPKSIEDSDKDIEYKYEFTKDKMVIKTIVYKDQEIIYKTDKSISRVCETDKFFYFMTSNKSAHVVKKDGFDKECGEDFIKYLKERFGYINYSRKR